MSETPQPPQEAAFFTSIRQWGIVRGDGVLGGVVAGAGARVGMAPVPARLITVLAWFILPGLVLLAYAAGWALLPDRRGSIVIQDFGRGVTNVGALIGIALMAVLGLAGLDNGPLFNVWSADPIGGGFGRIGDVFGLFAIVVPLLLLAGLIVAVVFLVRRARQTPRSGTPGTSWSSADAPAPPASDAAGTPADDDSASRTGDNNPASSADDDASAANAPTHPRAGAVPAASAVPTAGVTAPRSSGPVLPQPGQPQPGQPQPWEPALLPGDPRVNLPPQGAPRAQQREPYHGEPWGAPSGSAYAWNASTGQPAAASAPDYQAPRPPKPPRVPGPGAAGWLAFLGILVLAVAVVFAIERSGHLAVNPVLAWGAAITIGLGALLVVIAVTGRRLGFLGFLSVCAVLISLLLIANADEIRDEYGPWNPWIASIDRDDAPAPEASDVATAGPLDSQSETSIREEFGDDYSAVYLAGSCYSNADPLETAGMADSLVQYSEVDEDTSLTLRGFTTDLYVPAGTSLTIDGVGYQTVIFPDRGVSCDLWSEDTNGNVDASVLEMTNPDAPVLALTAVDGGTIVIHEEDSL